MKKVLLALALIPTIAQAGGISLRREYRGIHPMTGTEVIMEITNPNILHSTPSPITLEVENSAIRFAKSKILFKGYNTVESVFEVKDEAGELVARVVTEPPCTSGDNVVLVFASGVSATLKSTAP